MSNEIEFTVNEDGSVTEVVMKDDTTKVKISKVDITTGEELTGAKLVITDEDGNVVDEWISGETAHFIEGKLTAGKTYTLKETTAPDGYVLSEEITFSVNEDGTVNEVTMKDDTTKVKISKQDITTGEELTGAKLQVIDETGKIIEEWTSTNEQHFIEGKLTAGKTYTLCEITAPNGYEIAEDVTFTVNADGSVTEVVMKDEKTPETTTTVNKTVTSTPTVSVSTPTVSSTPPIDEKKRTITIVAGPFRPPLLLGGAGLLVKDDAQQAQKNAEIKPYALTQDVQDKLDRIADELTAETQAVNHENTATPESFNIPEIFTDATEIPETTGIFNISEPTEESRISDTLPTEIYQQLQDAAQTLTDAYPDAIGWLYIPDTSINYPLMQGEDNEFYLHHAYDGSYLSAGSVFLDCRCAPNFMNPINVVYAHNMKNGSMFAGVINFKNAEYFNSHRYGWLSTSDKVYRIDFFSVAVADWHDSILCLFIKKVRWSNIQVLTDDKKFSHRRHGTPRRDALNITFTMSEVKAHLIL